MASKAKWPPRASGGSGPQNRRFLNKALIAGDHSGAALAPRQNDREGPEALGSKIVFSLIKGLIAGDSSGAALAPKAKWPLRVFGGPGPKFVVSLIKLY